MMGGSRPKLTVHQVRALKLPHRGKRTLVVKRAETFNQPADMQRVTSELPYLASIGLISLEWLNDTDFLCRITETGLEALREASD